MKTTYIISATILSLLWGVVSCDLQRDPLGNFSDVTYNPGSKPDPDGPKYPTREKMKEQYDALYLSIRNGQEFWFTDYLVFMEIHSDNAYRGGTEGELYQLEKHSQDGTNKNINRDWDRFLTMVNNANRIICNIDSVPDQSLTQAERNRWRAEALIIRAWMWFDMCRLWGAIPMVMDETPDITAENFDQVAPLLFPERTPVDTIYQQMVEDLTFAEQHAPDVDPSNKFLLTKSVACALLAKIYAEKPIRNDDKVIQYCDLVIADDFDLVSDYSLLYGWNPATTEPKARNTVESIFEIVYPAGSGNWTSWMFGINLADPASTFDWQKWITPSRDLIAAFDTERDKIRKEEAIVWGQPSWSQHYPAINYPFMYKNRSNFNSIIKLRLADLLLLKAEALVRKNQLNEAASLVNRIRQRVKLNPLPAATTSNSEAMKQAVLKERRLELAFEGQRWSDLVRNDEAISVLNSLNKRDAGRVKMNIVVESRLLLPIPQPQIDNNANLSQNPGY